MSRINQAFETGKAFIAFLTCGDPDLETTERLVRTIAEAGADVIELGIPFSDPVAEGPVIQGASARALAHGATTDRILAMVKRLRAQLDTPLVFMTYANIVFSYGTERFIRASAEAGIDGLILPDVPFEEREEFAPLCETHGLDFIPLVTLASQDRIAKIAEKASGFVYCVSSLGVTGERERLDAGVRELVGRVRENTSVPAAVGFGISTPGQAAQMAALSDGVIVGSAIVRLVEQHGREAEPYVYSYVKSMKDAMRAL